MHYLHYHRQILLLMALLVFGQANANQTKTSHAVILIYHHVSNETPESTSVSPQQFEQHLKYLRDQGFQVWPLIRILRSLLHQDEAMPDKVVAITFDDAYESVYTQAWPKLARYGWPFTVFVNSDAIDRGYAPYMTWAQLRTLAKAGVEIGNHSASHAHLLQRQQTRLLQAESDDTWRARVHQDIARAATRIETEIGVAPKTFAYPYGEDSDALAAVVKSFGYFGITQRSGAVGQATDPLAVPRFPMASRLATLARLALAVHARPFEVIATGTQPPVVQGLLQKPDLLTMTLATGAWRQEQFACYAGAGDRLAITRLEAPAFSVQMRIAGIGQAGRNKVNCTAPASDGSGDFFWHAFQWIQLRPDGQWSEN